LKKALFKIVLVASLFMFHALAMAQSSFIKWGCMDIQQQNDITLKLNWSSFAEIGTSCFRIERSIDKLNYTKIGTVNSIKNSLYQTNYAYIDLDSNLLNLPTLIYYRITALNPDSQTFSSLVQSIEHIQKMDLPWKIEAPLYPNPFNDFFRIKFATTFPYPIKLSILNLLGVVEQEEHLDISQNPLVEVNTLNLKSGIYVIRLQFNKAVQYIRAIRQ
jgi:hypothetical protein